MRLLKWWCRFFLYCYSPELHSLVFECWTRFAFWVESSLHWCSRLLMYYWIQFANIVLKNFVCEGYCSVVLFGGFSSLQPLSRVRLFATPWNAACQASLSITNSRSSLSRVQFFAARQASLTFTIWEFAQTHVYWVGGAIQPFHLLSPPSPPALNLSQHQSLFQWVNTLHQVAKVLEFQFRHQSFQWIFRVNFL